MEDWKVLYASKLMTADEAVRQIPDGSRVFFGHAANEPPVLVDALVRNYEQYKDVEIVHWVPMGKGEYCDPKMKGHLRHNAMFVGGPTRKAVQEGRADYTPFFFHQSTRFFSDGTFPIDVAMVSVTPPDKHGYVSLGVSVGGTKPACLNAKMVIAQVNDQMPRTMGESFLHVSQLTCCVEASTPLPELGGGTIGEVEEAIGRNVASLVEDGSTLQLGIGTIPDAVLKFLGDKKDLGIHSEMFSDGVVDLYQKGVITGANKRLDKGKMVAAFLMGSKKLYDFVDDNPDVMMRTVDYVNNPAVICQNPKVVSINSCLQVDFNGQVNSESMGTKQFSGIGGQLDYVRGAAMCPDGKAILAMPSTAKHGEVSRIVPVFEPGTTVTTTRTDVHYIVTEYGVANLRAKSLRERARLLINIAHPKFRDQLWEAYYERYGKEDQNPKVVSINSCLQVDFNGQVNSESMGTKQFSGIGGQLDYVRGAAMCPDGKAILAMPSTAKHGEVSRIVPVFEPGTTVTTTRTDVHYIVTEYGVANLRAKSLRERARLLINIAHPKFRDQLWEAYYERYGKEDQ